MLRITWATSDVAILFNIGKLVTDGGGRDLLGSELLHYPFLTWDFVLRSLH